MTITQDLADIVLRPVDPRARERAALHVLDWLGCAVLGARSDAGKALISWAGREETGSCRAIAAGRRSLATALIVNGSVGNVMEMDDIHRASITHPGPVVVPAALAMAQREMADGAALLDAVVRGYEAMIRVGEAVGPGHYRFWHNTAACGAFGAAAAAGSLLGLGREQLTWAFGNAGTQAGGLWQVRLEPCMSKQLHNGRAAQSGVLSADLARSGFTGPAAILEGPLGYFAAKCPDGDAQRVVARSRAGWRIFETSFKPWPACRHAHAAIGAALELRMEVKPEDIEQIVVRTYRDALTFCDRPEPATTIEAKFSLQHSVAACLIDGAPTLATFEPAAIADRRIAALRARVQVAAAEPYVSAYPEHYGAAVEVSLRGGRQCSVARADALGDPETPLPVAGIIAKAETLLAAAGTAQPDIRRLKDAALALAEGGTVAALAEVLP